MCFAYVTCGNKKHVIHCSKKDVIFSDDDDYINIFFMNFDIICHLIIINRSNQIDQLIDDLKMDKYKVDEVDIFS